MIWPNLQVKLNISTTSDKYVLSGDTLPPREQQKMWIQFKISWIHTEIKKGMTTTLLIANNSLRAGLSALTVNERSGMLCHVGF